MTSSPIFDDSETASSTRQAEDDGGNENRSALVDVQNLSAVVMRKSLATTEELVAEYSGETNVDKREPLAIWLREYFLWFNKQNLARLEPLIVREYSTLMSLKPHSKTDNDFVKQIFQSLCDHLHADNTGSDKLLLALSTALECVEESVFTSDASDLFMLASELVKMVAAQHQILTRRTQCSQSPKLGVALKAMVLFEIVTREDEPVNPESYQRLLEDVADIKRWALYYPLYYYAHMIEYIVQKVADKSSEKSRESEKFTTVIGGLVNRWGMINQSAISQRVMGELKQASEAVAKAIKRRNDLKEQDWSHLIYFLIQINRLQMRRSDAFEVFKETLESLMKLQRGISEEGVRRFVRFGVVEQLGKAAVEDRRLSARKRAEKMLLQLGTAHFLHGSWGEESSCVSEAYFKALRDVYHMSDDNETIVDAIETMARNGSETLQVTLNRWLDEDPLEDLADAYDQQNGTVDDRSLFHTILHNSGLSWILHNQAECLANLKQKYTSLKFVEGISILSGEVAKHVKDFQYDLVCLEDTVTTRSISINRGGVKTLNRSSQPDAYQERIHRVKRSISVEEFFTEKTREHDVGREITQILIHGEPGSGKTSISKKLAYQWAMGQWGSQFKRLYHIELRAVRAIGYKCFEVETQDSIVIAIAIANLCFTKRTNSEGYERLVKQIDYDLEEPTTLVILDGLEESIEIGRRFEEQISERRCKRLLLSQQHRTRPEDGENEQVIECLGMSDDQLRTYIKREVGHDKGRLLTKRLKENPEVWRVAHRPITAQVACHVYGMLSTAEIEALKEVSLLRMYDKLVLDMWERFVLNRPDLANSREHVFAAVQKIAFMDCSRGSVLIEGSSLLNEESEPGAVRYSLVSSGYILPVDDGSEYFHFLHSSLQDFFAAFYLHRCLVASTVSDPDRDAVMSYVSSNKYSLRIQGLLTLLAQILANTKNAAGLDVLLSSLDHTSCELLHLETCLLQLRCIEAFLSSLDEIADAGYPIGEKALRVIRTTEEVLKAIVSGQSSYKICLLRHLMLAMQRMPKICSLFSQVVEPILSFIEQGEHPSWVVEDIEVLTGVCKNTQQHTERLFKVVKTLRGSEDSWICHRSIDALTTILEVEPRFASELLKEVEAAYSNDKDDDVQKPETTQDPDSSSTDCGEKISSPGVLSGSDPTSVGKQCAISLLSAVVAKTPSLSRRALLYAREACRDADPETRRRGLELLRNLEIDAPSVAADLLNQVFALCGDSEEIVRTSASECLRFLTATHPGLSDVALRLVKRALMGDPSLNRLSGVEALKGIVLGAHHKTSAVFGIALKALSIKDVDIQTSAVRVLGAISQIDPAQFHKGRPLSTTEIETVVNRAGFVARETISALCAVAPSLSNDIFRFARNLSESELPQDRIIGIDLLSCHSHLYEQAEDEVRSYVLEAFEDADLRIRCAVLRGCQAFVTTDGISVKDVISIARRALSDSEWQVQERGFKLLKTLVVNVPRSIEDVLVLDLLHCCDDDDKIVRSSWIELLHAIVRHSNFNQNMKTYVLAHELTKSKCERLSSEANMFLSEVSSDLVLNGFVEDENSAPDELLMFALAKKAFNFESLSQHGRICLTMDDASDWRPSSSWILTPVMHDRLIVKAEHSISNWFQNVPQSMDTSASSFFFSRNEPSCCFHNRSSTQEQIQVACDDQSIPSDDRDTSVISVVFNGNGTTEQNLTQRGQEESIMQRPISSSSNSSFDISLHNHCMFSCDRLVFKSWNAVYEEKQKPLLEAVRASMTAMDACNLSELRLEKFSKMQLL